MEEIRTWKGFADVGDSRLGRDLRMVRIRAWKGFAHGEEFMHGLPMEVICAWEGFVNGENLRLERICKFWGFALGKGFTNGEDSRLNRICAWRE